MFLRSESMNKSDRRGSTGRRGLTLLVAGLMANATLGLTEAHAGNCVYTERSYQAASLASVSTHTVVRNGAQYRSYVVSISRGDRELSSDTIKPGAQIAKLSGIGSEAIFNISIRTVGEPVESACSYKIYYENPATNWSLVRSDGKACGGAIAVTCSKTYHSGKGRWNTLFEIKG